MGGASGAPRLLTINFMWKKSSEYTEKHVKNMQKCVKIYKDGGGIFSQKSR